MTTNEFIRHLDELFAQGQYDKVEPFMLSALEEAKEREDYGLYLSVGNEMIGYYRSVSQFQKAYRISEDMLLLMEELQMDQSAEFATVLLNTATAYSFDGQFETALQFYRRTEQIYHLLVRPEDYLFAGLYNNMSSLLEKMGRNEEALELLMKALRILQNYPDRQMEAATNFTNLGLLYLKTGDYESGKKCVAQAVSMFEALDTPASHYSAALSALGEICYHEKDYEQAVSWYERTLTEIEKHYGLNLAYAVVCENLANVCREADKPDQAERYLGKAREVRDRLTEENRENPAEGGESTERAEGTGNIRRANDTENTEGAEEVGEIEYTGAKKAEKAECAGKTDLAGNIGETEKADNPGKNAATSDAHLRALGRCRLYYEKYGRLMLAQFPELQGHYAAGLVGEGSECFGYDDIISTDHDYFPRFFIWLDDEAYEKYGEPLQAAYEKLPKQWRCCPAEGDTEKVWSGSGERTDGDSGNVPDAYTDTVMTPEAAQRCGVCRTKDFYHRLVGREVPPENLYDWIALQETRLATATNGEVFEDCGGGFTAQREAYLSYFPEDVRRKKLASRLRKMAQMGQYQYARCMQRGESVAAHMALSEFIQNAGSCCFLLAREYMPYFKWMHRKMREYPVFTAVADKLEKLTLLSSQQDKWDREKPEKYRFTLNAADEKVVLIEEIAALVEEELRRQGLAKGQDTYLEPYAEQVEAGIEDPVLRAAKLV
jgi:tetratricopeptide (TPR) repeat protein